MTDGILYTQVGIPFTADAMGLFPGALPSNLLGVITAQVNTWPEETQVVAPTTSGIIMLAGPVYRATRTVNTPLPLDSEGNPQAVVHWVIPGGVAEQFLVVTEQPQGDKGLITVVFPSPNKGIQAFQPNNEIPLEVQITNLDGGAVDPSDLTLKLRSPQGQITTLNLSDFDHPIAGSFRYPFLPSSPGGWQGEWDSTETYVCGTGIIAFTVLPRITD